MKAKQFLTFHLLSIPLLRRNAYLRYILWSVVLVQFAHSYYKCAFEVIHVATSHHLNFIATCIINLVAYMFVEKAHSRLGDRNMFIIWAIMFLFTHIYESLYRYNVTDPTNCKTNLEIDIAEQMSVTGIFGCIFTFSSGVFQEIISENSRSSRETTREIHTPIEIRNITLSNGTYPRIRKIQSWLRKKCDATTLTGNELDTLRQTRNGHVVILRTGTSTDNYQICLSKQDIEQDERTSSGNTTSAVQHLQRLLKRFADNNVPYVVLCLLNTNESGNLMKQDKKLISHILERCLSEFKNAKVDIIYVVKSDTTVDLKDCSYDIQYKLNIKRETNTIYSRIFKAGEDDTAVKKRMGLYLERKFEKSIVEEVENTFFSENNSEVNHSANKSVHRRKNVDHQQECKEKDKSIFKEIKRQLHHSSPDNCEMNELKVLLERTDDVRGYGVIDHKIKIYVELEKQIASVRTYLNKYFTEHEGIVECELWTRKGDILKCTLKQGEKVVRSDTKFGTLGMFLKDQIGNTYFTTCSHVIRMDEIARGDGGVEQGKSVFAIDTATNMAYFDLIDLSIVKVHHNIASQCQFGLRTSTDNNVLGQIVEEDVIQEINQKQTLQVYKWGAKSQLTRGTYKGWIASKNQNRFDQNLHQIVNVSQKVFDEGDSGSLICFEATGSPHLDSDSAGFIFVGKSYPPNPSQDESENHWYYCYHVSKVFDQKVTNIDNLEACLDPNEPVNSIATGQMVQS